jgi:fatty-acid desaturase
VFARTAQVLGGFSGLVWAYSLPFVVVQTMTLGLNTVCHLWGARPYDTGTHVGLTVLDRVEMHQAI